MIEISQASSLPIYVQLINGVLDEIRNGELTAGDKVMSIRSLASQLEIAPNTVARAYGDLEKLGLIVSRHGGRHRDEGRIWGGLRPHRRR